MRIHADSMRISAERRGAQLLEAYGDERTLESLLAVPSSMTVPLLRLGPVWASLRDHPRFPALLEEYGSG